MSICAGCGEELDDYCPCSCAFGSDPVRRHKQSINLQIRAGGMRAMVARKLVRKTETKKESVG